MATNVYGIAGQQQKFWQNALSEDNPDDVHSNPPSSQATDKQMMCDIQCLLGCLVAKAEQLLGEYICMHACTNMLCLLNS